MEGWLSGRKHLTANEAVRNGTGVRISHLPLNITEAPARELRDEISEVLRNGTGKLTCKRADHWPIMMKDWRYCFKGLEIPKLIHSRTRGNARCKRNRTSSTISE